MSNCFSDSLIMDSIIKWNVTDDVNSLVESILSCKKELTKLCFSKCGSAKSSRFDVFASAKICEFLMISEDHSQPEDSSRDDYYKKHLARFKQFDLYRLNCIDDETIRVLVYFDVGENFDHQWYGNILLS